MDEGQVYNFYSSAIDFSTDIISPCLTYDFTAATKYPLAVFGSLDILNAVEKLGFTYLDTSVAGCDCNDATNLISGSLIVENLDAPIYSTT